MSWIFDAIGLATDWLTGRMRTGKKVEQYIGEAALGTYVCFSTQDEQAFNNALNRVYGGINAYVYMMNPACIYSCMWETVNNQPALKAYFSSRPEWAEWEAWHAKAGAPELIWAGMRSWVEAVDLMPLWNPFDAIMSMFTTQPIVVEIAKWKALDTVLSKAPIYSDAVVNTINTVMKPTITDPSRTYAPLGVWMLKNPCLWSDWAAISAGIITAQAYKDAWKAAQEAANVAPFTSGQRLHAEVGEKYPHVLYFNTSGEARLDLLLPAGTSQVVLDTYGLKRTLQRVLAPDLRFFNTSKNFEASFADPDQIHAEKVSETETIYYIEDLPPSAWGGKEPDYDDYMVHIKQAGTNWLVEIWAGEVEDGGRFTWRGATIYERPPVMHYLPYEKVYSGVLV
jgi:hypothetical protein